MTHEAMTPVEYRLSLDREEIPLNPWLGGSLTLRFLGTITCIAHVES